MTPPRQGDVWWAEVESMRRPVLIVSRTEAAGSLNRLIVAPITRNVRGIPTEIPLGPDDGLAVRCAASFDNLTAQPIVGLTQRIGSIQMARQQICGALAALADC